MDRRRFLLAGGTGLAGTLAGCSVGYAPQSEQTATPVPRSAFRRSAPQDGIPAITDPAFAPDWSSVAIDFGGGTTYRPRLDEADLVIGVVTGALARAYPLKVLDWHEVVNDSVEPRSAAPEGEWAGGPLLVTYCPLCRSGLVAERTVDGCETRFGVSGLLYRENLVLYDEATGSLWSQLLAEAVRGPKTGSPLAVLPSSLTTWGRWLKAHPATEVLLPPPLSDTVVGAVRIDYGFDLVGQTREAEDYLDERLGDDYDDSRLPARELVLGVATDGAATAYPVREVAGRSPVEDTVGETPVVVAFQRGSAVAYDRRVDGEALTFERADGDHLVGAGSRWSVSRGVAVDGPYEGTSLRQVNTHPPLFFFAWRSFHPETRVWRPT